jgi:hypothetical protein
MVQSASVTPHIARGEVVERRLAGSAVERLLGLLPEAPLVTARTVQRLLGVSFPSAWAAVEALAEARILTRKQVERGTTGYLARDVFDLLTDRPAPPRGSTPTR